MSSAAFCFAASSGSDAIIAERAPHAERKTNTIAAVNTRIAGGFFSFMSTLSFVFLERAPPSGGTPYPVVLCFVTNKG